MWENPVPLSTGDLAFSPNVVAFPPTLLVGLNKSTNSETVRTTLVSLTQLKIFFSRRKRSRQSKGRSSSDVHSFRSKSLFLLYPPHEKCPGRPLVLQDLQDSPWTPQEETTEPWNYVHSDYLPLSSFTPKITCMLVLAVFIHCHGYIIFWWIIFRSVLFHPLESFPGTKSFLQQKCLVSQRVMSCSKTLSQNTTVHCFRETVC